MLFPVIVKKLKTMEVSILIIRQERPEDYDTVYHVVKEAFENAEYTDGNEQNLVAALRKKQIVYSGTFSCCCRGRKN